MRQRPRRDSSMQRLAVTRRSQKVRCAFDSISPERPIQLQKHLLRDLFGTIAIVEEVPGDAEDHVLMLADERPERVVIAVRGAMKIRVVCREEKRGGGGHLRLYTEKSGNRMQLHHRDTKDTEKNISVISVSLWFKAF